MKYFNLTQLNNSISPKLIRYGVHSYSCGMHSCRSLFNGPHLASTKQSKRPVGNHSFFFVCNCHEKLGVEIFYSPTANQGGNTRAFGSKSPGVTENTVTAAIKKRLDRIFLNNEYVLVWASFKPTGHILSYKLEKLLTLDPCFGSFRHQSRENNKVSTDIIASKDPAKAALLNLLQKQGHESGMDSLCSSPACHSLLNTLKVSKTSLPKNVLNNYCFNVTLPIVGCGIDLLSLHEPYSLATGPALEPQALSVDVNLVERNYYKLLGTHRAAYFLKQALEIGGLQDKWHCNQLLGAFVKSQKCVNFVGSSELRQSLALQQALKQLPELMAMQPFVKAIHKFKYSHSGQTRCIGKLFQKLTSIIDYKLKQV